MFLNPLNRRIRERNGFPVLPGAFPFVGHVPAIATDFHTLLLRAEHELGSHFWIELGFWGMQLVCTLPEAFDLLKNKVTDSALLLEKVPDMLDCTMLAMDGPPHRQRRMPMNRPLLPPGLTASRIGTIFAEGIERRVNAWRGQPAIRLVKDANELALSLMFRMLGVEEADVPLWREKYEQYVLLGFNVPIDLPGMPGPRGRRARDWIDEQLRILIRTMRERDASALLTELARSFEESEEPVPEKDMLANIRVLVLAGHETSASLMASIVIELAGRPDAWDALCTEVARAGGIPRSPKELADFPYAEAVFRETLRLHPPFSMVTRRAQVDFELGGRLVPAGTHLNIPLIHLSRDAAAYEQPTAFLPERWLESKESVKPIETLQFGTGPHFCLGYHVAWLEIVQFIAALALTMGGEGLRPRLLENCGKRVYLPISRPHAGARVTFA